MICVLSFFHCVCACMYVCMYVHMHVYVCVCMFIYIYTHAYVYICACVLMYVCVDMHSECMCVHVCVHMHVCVLTCPSMVLGIISLPLYSLRQGPPLNAKMASLGSQVCSTDLLSLPPECWDYRWANTPTHRLRGC